MRAPAPALVLLLAWVEIPAKAQDPVASSPKPAVSTAAPPHPEHVLLKCCAVGELWVHQEGCRNATEWAPLERVGEVQDWEKDLAAGRFDRVQVGNPRCANTQPWALYHYKGSHDSLRLLSDGRLRHTTRSHAPPDHPDIVYERDPPRSKADDRPWHEVRPPYQPPPPGAGLETSWEDEEEERLREEHGELFSHDYMPGSYCIDRIAGRDFDVHSKYAVVCAPHLHAPLNGTDFIMRKIVNPVCHGVAIACYLLVAVLYFVLPQLRDLVGNMLTTLATCLIVSQAADLVRIFTQFTNHVSFLVADAVMYISLLAAFFWLNSLGFYIWKTFRSRNVFLRVTDARKYCYYSSYTWVATLTMAFIALFAHFMLDNSKPSVPSPAGKQETIGRLGIAIFFTPIAFTILVNIFFYLTTGQAISRVSTRGRIHHKMKFCFDMFVKLFLVMAVGWLFLVLAWLPYDALAYCHIIANLLQAVLFVYITILGQKRVTMLIRQSFCADSDNQDAAEWGEEMSPMSSNHY